MKPRLHFHSDAEFFAGCENMLVNFFADESLRREYRISFSYQRSEAYDAGLRWRVPELPELFALELPDADVWAGRLPSLLRPIFKLLARLFALRVWLALWNAWRLERLFRELSPQVLHINNGNWPGGYTCQAAALAAQRAKVPAVVYVVNNMAIGYGWRRWAERSLDRAVAAAVDRFVVASRAPALRLREILSLPAESVSILPNGIAPRPHEETREQTRRRLGLPEQRVVAASIALLERRKGHALLLRALARLERRPLLVIEGEGPEKSNLEALLEELGLSSDVRFIGRERNIFDLLGAADILVESSLGFSPAPNIVAEAMSQGLAVLASVHSSSEQLEDGRTGLLVDPSDTSALAAALASLERDPALRRRLGEAAARAFAEKFAAGPAVERYRALYSSLRRPDW